MDSLTDLIKKKEKKVIGLLSGTSVDSVDAVLIKILNSGSDTEVEVLDFITIPIDVELRKFIFKCSTKEDSSVEEICRLNFILGHLFADGVKEILKKNNLSSEEIDLIGSHGQTIYHIPVMEEYFGKKTKSTFQTGDPSVIANLTGITTVGDFRNADVAVNGGGAPLVPYLDYILFRDNKITRVLLNIGGIANITFLQAGCKKKDVVAFDTGPGNILIDNLMRKLYDRDHDYNGEFALKGNVNEKLFEYLCEKDEFYKELPPKSTGREYYGDNFIQGIISEFNKADHDDIVRTVTEFTAFTIHFNVKEFTAFDKINELIVSGGGARNPCIMSSLKKYFEGIDVREVNKNGIDSENKEAVLFAVLANETISGNSSNITSVTGAEKEVLLGKICIA